MVVSRWRLRCSLVLERTRIGGEFSSRRFCLYGLTSRRSLHTRRWRRSLLLRVRRSRSLILRRVLLLPLIRQPGTMKGGAADSLARSVSPSNTVEGMCRRHVHGRRALFVGDYGVVNLQSGELRGCGRLDLVTFLGRGRGSRR